MLKRMESEHVKYTYAVQGTDLLTHISEADRNTDYRCSGCNSEVIPVKGPVNAHHFRHANNCCSYESFLHKTAKIAFYQAFLKALSLNTPISLEIPRLVTCTSKRALLLDQYKTQCCSNVPAYYDLTSIFNNAELEEFDPETRLRPDILISNSEHQRKCYIEVFVTHAVSEEKINTRIPILEFNISDITDIEYIKSGKYNESDQIINLYHFTAPDKHTQNCHKHCTLKNTNWELWSINDNGRVNREFKKFEELKEHDLKIKTCWQENLDEKTITENIIQLINIKDPDKDYPNCVICTQSGTWNNGEPHCKKKRITVPYTEAKQCQFYEISA